MINTRKLSFRQLELVQAIIKHAKGRLTFTRKELRDIHGELKGRKASPYFISKNLVAKVKGQRGMYNLEPFIKFAKQYPPKKEETATRREAKPKREAVATKKGVASAKSNKATATRKAG